MCVVCVMCVFCVSFALCFVCIVLYALCSMHEYMYVDYVNLYMYVYMYVVYVCVGPIQTGNKLFFVNVFSVFRDTSSHKLS